MNKIFIIIYVLRDRALYRDVLTNLIKPLVAIGLSLLLKCMKELVCMKVAECRNFYCVNYI